MTLQRFLVVTLIVLQSACSGLPPAESDAVQARRALESRLLSIQCWDLGGKLGIRLPGEAHSIGLDWKQQRDFYHLRLSGPLGVGGAEVTGEPGRVQLRISEEEILEGTSPEALVEKEFGWQLPLSSLIYWVRGISAPGMVVRKRLNDQNLMAELDQHGWQLEFQRYKHFGEGAPSLPEKVRLTQGELVVIVVIKDWRTTGCN